jgi:hypothetical protein
MSNPRPNRTPSPGRVTLAAQLRGVVSARRLSATALGRDAGVDVTQLGKFLRGSKTITLDTADRLSAALGLRLTEAAARRQPAAPKPPAPGVPECVAPVPECVAPEPAAGPADAPAPAPGTGGGDDGGWA